MIHIKGAKKMAFQSVLSLNRLTNLLHFEVCKRIHSVQCLHTYSRRKMLLTSLKSEISLQQRRWKQMEQQSNIQFYHPKKQRLPRKGSLLDQVSDGIEIIKKGIPEYKKELIEGLNFDVNLLPKHGDFEYFQKFDGNESLKNWLVSTDMDSDQGKSTAAFTVSPAGKGLFHGHLNTEVPKDGISQRAGYCNIRSPYKKMSFERPIPYDWSRYTHMFLKIRGDGRNYMIILHMFQNVDLLMYDMYNYPLFTRGGPYWQYVKIPLSSFFLAAHGRTQDKQKLLNLSKIKSIGITAGDGIHGPFCLEIDYIALLRDETADHYNDFKYEMYRTAKYDV